ncbi:MAG: TIGR00730 family Rossman fold protein [Alphaproteobacteria bacterium]|nr:TIGR00730 family Rossman fold protein [Alphaproteobacteria bacterium]
MNLLTVYLGSSGHARPVFKEAAQRLGSIIGQQGKSLIYGGMDAGLMGTLAINALKNGANVTGIIPEKIKDNERMLHSLTKTIMVEDLCDRKKLMFMMADAVIIMPGGFGTLDEGLEVLYWNWLGLHNKPIVLLNIDNYWTKIIDYLNSLTDFNKNSLIVVNNVDEIIPTLEKITTQTTMKIPPHLPHFEDEITRNTAQPIIIDRANIENTYFVICALGLKQLGQHNRAIGFLNTNGTFDKLLKWIEISAEETFITTKCLKLFSAHNDENVLRQLLEKQEAVKIDLHKEKWGAKQTSD